MRSFSFVLMCLALGFAVAAPPGTFWSPCDASANYPFKVTDINMPDPVINPTVNITLTGTTSVVISGGNMKMALSFDGIPIYSETTPLCNLGTKCPMPAGTVVIAITRTFPKAPFKGTITGTVSATDASGGLLTCVKMNVPVTPPQQQQINVMDPPGTFWKPCSATTKYPFTVTDVTMPVPVSNPTFNISLTGTLAVAITSGSIKYALSFDGIPIYSATDNICSYGMACPIQPGNIKFTTSKTFPKAPFSGTITGTVTALDGSGNVLSCVSMNVKVIPPQ
eukprot:PhF_6_TR19239/c0_g1_i1/m.28286